jgi:hypothetical protein
LNAACNRAAGSVKCSVSDICTAVLEPAPAYNIARAVEMLVCENTKLPRLRARSARYRSSEKARLSFAKVAASSLLTTGAVTRALFESRS